MRTIAKPVVRSRGRKAELDPTLVKNLHGLALGTWAVFDEFGTVTDGKKQSAIGQKVRTHYKAAFDGNPTNRVSIRWSPAGECQVGILPPAEGDEPEPEPAPATKGKAKA